MRPYHGLLPNCCRVALLFPAAVALEIIAGSPRALARPSTATVYVQDFLDIFQVKLPSLRALDFGMQNMGGQALTPGDGSGFIRDKSMAPARFQIRENKQWNYAVEDPTKDVVETRLEFDEFCLERVMLAKWLKTSTSCGDEACRRSADIVVAPSLILHAMVSQGFSWATVQGYAGDASLHLKYFKMLLDMYPANAKGHPVFVIHSSFVNGSPKGLYDALFLALAALPSTVQRRFIFASIESNLGKKLTGIYGDTWSDSGHIQTLRRKSGEDDGGPLLVTLPYPIPVVAPVKWTHTKAPYVAPRRRPISLLFLGASTKGAGASGDHNVIRPLLFDYLDADGKVEAYRPDVHAGPMARVDYGIVCLDPDQPNKTDCGIGPGASFWELTAASDFCLQPPGDTLTRSHFYIAVLSGCIPIIFDGGHKDFDAWEQTWWAWRASQTPPPTRSLKLSASNLWDAAPLWEASDSGMSFFDYREFAIVADASRVGNIANMTSFLRKVRDLPHADPERFIKMRRNLDRVAPFMTYRNSVDPETPDAFVAFEALVRNQVTIPAMRSQAMGGNGTHAA